MLKSLWNGATGMNAQMLKLDTIANNLSNVNTVGYKKNQTNFQDLIYQTLNQVGNPVNLYPEKGHSLQNGVGVKVSSTNKVFTQGSITQTDRPLDIAIEGKGFFRVILPNGDLAYTRDGVFQVNELGKIVNSATGFELEGNFTIPEKTKAISVSQTGEITVTGDYGEKKLGTINLYSFNNLMGLEAIGQNLLQETPASGNAVVGSPGEGYGKLRQGFLENSNVDTAEEFSQLIQAQRAYELNSRSIKTSDEMWAMANNLKR